VAAANPKVALALGGGLTDDSRMLKTFLIGLALVAGSWSSFANAADAASTKILFLSGPRDHGAPGRHEYERDLKTLAQSLAEARNLAGVTTQLIVGKMPRDSSLLDGVAAIVIDSSSDRAENEVHPLFPPDPTTNHRAYDAETAAWLKAVDERIKRDKIGVVILHYATWAENTAARAYHMGWVGGLWVQAASKNPVDEWSMKPLNKSHPILRGVKPWKYRDEVFCRFLLPNDQRRTDLLLATPHEDKLGIGPQIAAWAYQRDDGGRGFVFGGLDFRDNLAREDLRRFLLNGIGWAARLEVPKGGVQSPTPDVSDVSPARPRPVKAE
jgi:hypothetical protein